MKLIHLPILGLILASSAVAADLSPNTVGPLSNASDYLVYKPLQTGEYQLGLDFTQALEAGEDKVIERRMNVAIGLPAQTAFGFSLVDTQEYAFDHSVKPLGAYAWLRWNIIESQLINVSTSLQFQPGLSTRESRYQASQDRTSLGLDVKLQPLDYVSTAVYGSYSRRQDERYQDMTLGNEALAGFRLALGTRNIGIFGDGSQRYLETSGKRLFARTWQAGAYIGTDSLQASIFSLIPDTNRYPGTFERGYGISLSARVGGAGLSDFDKRDQPEDAIKAVAKADNDAVEAARKAEKAPEIKILETSELDEFQMLEQKEKQAAKNQKESATEKAEREMREALEKEKKLQAQKAIEQERARKEAGQSMNQQIREDDPKVQKYRDEVNEEINAYTLPDQDDLNWNGLITK